MPFFDIAQDYIDYQEALDVMNAKVLGIQEGIAYEEVWLLEHSPVYTAGTSAKAENYSGFLNIPFHETGRGGQHTYHGPGQRVAYIMIDLKRRQKDVRAYVRALEQLGIDTLNEFGVKAMRDEEGVGLWVHHQESLKKIAAIGVRISKWVTSHGMAFNIHPNLDHYAGIVPCGISTRGITSLKALGIDVAIQDFDAVFIEQFKKNPFLKGESDV